MQWINFVSEYLKNVKVYSNTISLSDILEILIIAFLVYYMLAWMKTTRSWRMLKGLVVIFLFFLVVDMMEMNNIIWIFQNVLGFAVTAVIVVMQPELRHALEQLGEKNFLPSIGFSSSSRKEEDTFSEKTVSEIAKACVEMGKVNGIVTSQLLINIFEHNTPLHDGAVLVRGNRVTYATCYLPLSDNLGLSKELGTRHRAGVGVSEVTDSLTVIVSEETGGISVAYEGKLQRNLNAETLKEKMRQAMNMNGEEDAKGRYRRKGKNRAKGKKKAAE